jgi:hypothetical protein
VALVCYADDVLNLTRSLQRIKENFSILESEYSKLGPEFKSDKTEDFLFNWGNSDPTQLFQLGRSLGKPVEKLVYLSLPIGQSLKQTRLLLMSDLEKICGASYPSVVGNKKKSIDRIILAKLYNSTALPHFIYTARFWKILSKPDKRKLRTVYFEFTKYLLHYPYRPKIQH